MSKTLSLFILLMAVDEIQVACYKILAALYQLGTDLSLDKSRKFIKIALDRNRPAVGACLGAFAATFPVAFLEPMMNKQNPFSIHNRIADQSLEAQGNHKITNVNQYLIAVATAIVT